MRRANRKRSTLEFCSLEERAVPANNLTVVDDLTGSSGIVSQQVGDTITVLTTGAGAQIALSEISTLLTTPGVSTVILTTEADSAPNDAGEAGDFNWDTNNAGFDLDLTGFGPGKTLKIVTDATATSGAITLTDTGFFSFGNDTLKLELDSSAANGAVLFASSTGVVQMNLPGAGGLNVNAGTGNFTYQSGLFGANLSLGGSLTISAATIDLGGNTLMSGGNMSFTGTSILLNNDLLSSGGSMAFAGPVTLTPGTVNEISSDGPTTFSSTIDGDADLIVDVKSVTFNGNVGAGTPLLTFELRGGESNHNANTITATTINIGPGFQVANSPALFGNGSGLVTGNVFVSDFGHLTPGGNGVVGVLDVVGNVTFAGGHYSPDLGAVADVLNVDGDVSISFGKLGNGVGIGTLPPLGTANIISYTGVFSGEFDNAFLDSPVIVGSDAVKVTQYSTSPVQIVPLVAAANLPGTDFDGTGYTIKLTGGGELVTFKDNNFIPSVVVRDAKSTSSLTVTTKANGSDDIVAFNDIVVNGSLAKFTGAKVDIVGSLRTTNVLKSATFRELRGKIEGGGSATDKTTLTAGDLAGQAQVKVNSAITSLKVTNNIGATISAASLGMLMGQQFFGTLTTPGALGTIKLSGALTGTIHGGLSLASLDTQDLQGTVNVAGDIKSIKGTLGTSGSINAGSIGTLKTRNLFANVNVTGALSTLTVDLNSSGFISASSMGTTKVGGNLTGNWNVQGGVKALTAGQINFFGLTAQFLETLTVKADAKTFSNGGVNLSSFVLTSNNGAPAGSYGLKTVTISGTVDTTPFDVQEGNVKSFTAGRFVNSQLYVDYTAAPPFNTDGNFGAGPTFALGSFKTTAATIGDPSHPLNWSFSASEVAARKIGTVELSGVKTDNGGNAFGIKSQDPGTVVKVKSAGPGVVAPLFPGALPAGFNVDDFFVLDI